MARITIRLAEELPDVSAASGTAGAEEELDLSPAGAEEELDLSPAGSTPKFGKGSETTGVSKKRLKRQIRDLNVSGKKSRENAIIGALSDKVDTAAVETDITTGKVFVAARRLAKAADDAVEAERAKK